MFLSYMQDVTEEFTSEELITETTTNQQPTGTVAGNDIISFMH